MAERAQVDIAVIGAGPAGMAAAVRAAQAGVSVALLDENPAAGGAVWRGLDGASGARREALERDYPAGYKALARLAETDFLHMREARVWEVTRERVISYSQGGNARQLSARRIILATGALERPMPFPGWTLPGVLTAGAAQIMLKTGGLAPAGPIVMAGSGPLLFLVAAQLVDAGHPPAAIVDTTPASSRVRALRRMPMRPSAWASVRTGLKWMRKLRRSGVRIYRGASGLEASGAERVNQLRFRCRDGNVDLRCATLVIHAGVVPNVQLSRAIGIRHEWDDEGIAWHPKTDGMGRTEIEGFLVAGDGAGIAGAEAAVHSGRLAALAALDGLTPVDTAEITRERRTQHRNGALRPVLNAMFSPGAEFLRPDDDTIICRCEAVTAGRVRQLVRQGCLDPNAVKSQSRAGMGACQGRYCGLTVSQIVAETLGISPAEAGYFRLRSPVVPVSLGELAGLDIPEGDNG